MECFKVIKKGLLTTIQDEGRLQYLQYGVSRSGVMDEYSYKISNILVGNDLSEAVIEITLVGPELEFLKDCLIALTGGDLTPKLNGRPINMWKTIIVKKGDRLTFGAANSGCRTYLSIMGGVNVPKIMGSYATFIRGEYGGFHGRALEKGDVIQTKNSSHTLEQLKGRLLKSDYIPNWEIEKPIRIIQGPHYNSFTEDSLRSFLKTSYIITNDSDRMGYRLEGSILKHKHKPDIISDFVGMGTIQVPGSQQPIIHMADCGTSGGYTKIGVISRVDLPKVAQKKPGQKLRFTLINQDESEKLWLEENTRLYDLMLVNKTI